MTFITPIASAAAAPRLSIASAAAAPRLSIDPRRSSSRSTRRGLRWPFALALFVGACADAPADGIEDGAAAADLGEGRDQAAGDLACASSCGGACVDLQSDPANCGRCGVTCARGEACLMGSCQSAMTPGTRCAMTPPAGARQPPALPRYSGGSCPTLVAGMNGLKSGAANRSLLLALPKDLRADERPPLVFLWHWLGGSAESFYTKGDVQKAVDTQRFIAVMPVSKGDLFKWPFEVTTGQPRVDEELRYFDDMLSCVGQQFAVNRSCVSSAGVSAGALWTDLLAGQRGQYLSSAISLSGGTGGVAKPFGNPEHRMPFLVLWGGAMDNCLGLVNFQAASKNLETALQSRGHFFLECVHNCGHAEPPFEAPMGLSTYAGLWQFVFDHPYWLEPGASPYLKEGLPAAMPPWCGIGAGSATPRTGVCPNKPGC